MIQNAQVIDEEGGLTETVQELPGSPVIKKGILQSIEIVDELVKVMGYRPKSIVIEMACETQKTHGTHRRKERIQHVFEKLKDTSGLPEELPSSAELSNEREYLYWLQGEERSLHREMVGP